MRRDNLERHQVWCYLAAILLGLVTGYALPSLATPLEALLWPALAFLLYATFTQIPVARLPEAVRDRRFMAAALLGNFMVLPVLIWLLLPLTPAEPAIRLGVLLVLLVPCTDWFITFAHQAGGDTNRAVAITPVMLLFQIVLLPAYLWLFLGNGIMQIVSAASMVMAFVAIIVAPLVVAWLSQHWASKKTERSKVIDALGWAPVPVLALVLFMIAASQVNAVMNSFHLFGPVLLVFILFLIGASICGITISKLFSLPAPQARTLLFSFATRNSFVVLPLALALPDTWEAAAVVIVFQSLVELFGVLALLWLVPRKLIP